MMFDIKYKYYTKWFIWTNLDLKSEQEVEQRRKWGVPTAPGRRDYLGQFNNDTLALSGVPPVFWEKHTFLETGHITDPLRCSKDPLWKTVYHPWSRKIGSGTLSSSSVGPGSSIKALKIYQAQRYDKTTRCKSTLATQHQVLFCGSRDTFYF